VGDDDLSFDTEVEKGAGDDEIFLLELLLLSRFLPNFLVANDAGGERGAQ